MTPTPAGYEQAVWAWTRHLRSGGTTPWSAFAAAGPVEVAAPTGRLLPSAAQLELVRRAAAQANSQSASSQAVDTYAEVVLSRSGPGRGRAQQPLSWPGRTSRIGAPPVDPADVPLDELVRLAVGALTELLLSSPPVAPRREPRRGLLAGRPAFLLAGAPVTASVVRRRLAAAGHREGGRAPTVVVLAEPLDRALAQVWSARVQRGAPVRWPGFCRRWVGRELLPPAADAAALARLWAQRLGADQVHVVVAPGSAQQATDAVAAVLGVDLTATNRLPQARVLDLPPAGVDALRRVNAVLAVRAGDRRRVDAVRTGLPLLEGVPAPGGLTVPEPFRDWLAERAAGLADELSDASSGAVYRVQGTPGALVPGDDAAPTRPRRADVLRVVVGASLRHLDHGPAASGGGER